MKSCFLSIVLLICAYVHAPCGTSAGLEKFIGTWKGKQGDNTYTETWEATADGMLRGTGCWGIQNETGCETLFIIPSPAWIVYLAFPDQQTPTSFHTHTGNRDTYIFENPEHDFPSGIRYEFLSNKTLKITLMGKEKGQQKEIVFNLEKSTR